MCDVYQHKCKECDTMLDIHLGNFSTEREEIEVFCQNHLPEEDVRIFTVTTPDQRDENIYSGWKMGIRSLTDNARANKNINHPNIFSDWKIEDR